MKTFLIVCLVTLMPLAAFANPHLTADPQTDVVAYECTWGVNPTPEIYPPFDNGDGTQGYVKVYDRVGGATKTIKLTVNYTTGGGGGTNQTQSIIMGWLKKVFLDNPMFAGIILPINWIIKRRQKLMK